MIKGIPQQLSMNLITANSCGQSGHLQVVESLSYSFTLYLSSNAETNWLEAGINLFSLMMNNYSMWDLIAIICEIIFLFPACITANMLSLKLKNEKDFKQRI